MAKKYFRCTRDHFGKLKKIRKDEGIGQMFKYDFDKSIFRVFIPYISELVPPVLGVMNYRLLVDESVKKEEGRFEKVLKHSISGMLSVGSETFRALVTTVVYNETKSLEATLLTYTFLSGFCSLRNQFRVDRFYKPHKKGYLKERLYN